MLDGGGAAVEAAVPSSTKGPSPEVSVPAGETKPSQEAGKQISSEAPKDTGKKGDMETELVQQITGDLEQADKNSKTFPEGCRVALTDLTAKGDIGKHLELTGQAMREKANTAPTEGEGVEEQKMQQLALGYDTEIGSLQIQYSRTKNTKERQVISDKIKTLQQEKIDKTGIKENQIDDLAKFFDLGGNFTKFIEDNINKGTPMLAVTEILKTAVVDKNVRLALFTKIDGSNLSADQKKVFKESLNRKAMVKRTEKVAKMAGIGSLLAMILMMYSGLKKEKQGMG
ncbi:hypothetical protein COY87_05185 [Candidatus Roizmanbacteria bacterium CG_4_10_14_0_8_um_filter_33_9]|uniref:Uncharacterized protein n=1 Tax=Candidatus Roizmanbacteria bacterium CG_4_10_14_0_8_um_filter_33_9 TaxID=1974826 RepID=A0A2M7QH23_9BACT|nr:MAG: hypothetical protein COY87_05185 [Candidatus Roizmanbacteria bacterium CG_4_10_14_0_8_um_filter_33_9]